MAYTLTQITNTYNKYYKIGTDVFRASDNATVKMDDNSN